MQLVEGGCQRTSATSQGTWCHFGGISPNVRANSILLVRLPKRLAADPRGGAGRYWNPNYYRRRQYELAEGNEMGFLESVFSFVFGDGDPNDNLDALRYEQIANVIKANGASYSDGATHDAHTTRTLCHAPVPLPGSKTAPEG